MQHHYSRLYQGVDWSASKSYRPDPPSTVLEPRPDMVTQRIRRYEDSPELWQVYMIKKTFLLSVKGNRSSLHKALFRDLLCHSYCPRDLCSLHIPMPPRLKTKFGVRRLFCFPLGAS